MIKISKVVGLALALGLAISVSGCGSSNPKPAKQNAQNKHKYKIGKTTIDNVLSELGNPSGRSYNSKGEDVLIYTNRHITGKQFIPFYYGSDSMRMKTQKFTFSKDSVLSNYTVNESHY